MITKYINTDPGQGWRRLSSLEEELGPNLVSFERKGLQVIASVQEAGEVPFVHLSIGQMPSLVPHLTKQQLSELQRRETPHIIKLFFGEVQYMELPVDPRMPNMTHFALKVEK